MESRLGRRENGRREKRMRQKMREIPTASQTGSHQTDRHGGSRKVRHTYRIKEVKNSKASADEEKLIKLEELVGQA